MNAHNLSVAFQRATQADIIHAIELHCSCTVSVQEVADDYEGEWKVRGFRAWANRDDEFRPGCSRTVETSDGDTAIEALDNLASRLGYVEAGTVGGTAIELARVAA